MFQKKRFVIIIPLLLLFPLFSIVEIGLRETNGADLILFSDPLQAEAHPAIYYGSDAAVSSAGLDGLGTYDQPYLIQNYEIDASSEDGITLSHIRVHVRIQNCTVTNGGDSNNGIYIYNCSNVQIVNNTIDTNHYGLYMRGNNTNIQVLNNIIANSDKYGIYLLDPNFNNTFSGNNISNTDSYALSLHSGANMTIVNNSVGFSDWALSLSDLQNSSIINNTIFNATSHGIRAYRLYDTTIENNTFFNNEHALNLYDSLDSLMKNNLIFNCLSGIELGNSSYGRLEGNNVSCEDGSLSLQDSNFNNFTSNMFFKHGIWIREASTNGNHIDPSNTFNNLPIMYYENAHDDLISNLSNIGQIIVNNCTNLTFNNVSMDDLAYGFSLWNCSSINLLNLTDSRSIDGFYAYNSNETYISSCTFLNSTVSTLISHHTTLNSSSFMGTNTYFTWASGNHIVGSNFTGEDYGVSLRYSTDCVVEYNRFEDQTRYGCEDVSGLANIIQYNHFSNLDCAVYVYGTNTTVFSNVVLNVSDGFRNGYSQNCTFSTNYLSNCERYGIWIDHSIFTLLDANTIITSQSAIFVSTCESLDLLDNNLHLNQFGIQLFDSTENNIQENQILNNTYLGIELIDSHINSLTGNNINYNHQAGVHLTESYNNTILQNNISFNGILYGEDIMNYSSNRDLVLYNSGGNLIQENIFSGKVDEYGIYIVNDQVVPNEFENNTYLVSSEDSSGNCNCDNHSDDANDPPNDLWMYISIAGIGLSMILTFILLKNKKK